MKTEISSTVEKFAAD